MEESRDLYQEEINNLKKFQKKIDTHAIYKKDLEFFSDQYEEIIAQAKVITRVSDRLQKKLDKANSKIRDQNAVIQDKNEALEVTIEKLAKARVGKKAAAMMVSIALILFIIEQIFLQPIINQYLRTFLSEEYVFLGSLLVFGLLFFLVKFFEGSLERYFLNEEKKKILKNKVKISS